jgi:hypothetical protein
MSTRARARGEKKDQARKAEYGFDEKEDMDGRP